MTIDSEDAMKRFGTRLGQVLHGGECIELIGDIGSGKTTLTKGIAMGLAITETVQSPTFTINRVYDAPSGVRLSHYDFYRLNDAGIMAEELRESLDEPKTSIVIEWGDVVAPVLPRDCLRITFASPTESGRILMLEAGGPHSRALLESLI